MKGSEGIENEMSDRWNKSMENERTKKGESRACDESKIEWIENREDRKHVSYTSKNQIE